MGSGFERPVETESEPSGDGRDIDIEPGGELAAGAFAAIREVKGCFRRIIPKKLHKSS